MRATTLPLRGFLHRPAIDLFVLLGPWLIVGLLLATGFASVSSPARATWIAQFVLGNTTHVILTFVLLAYRRDVLRATPNQAKIVVIGSAVTFAATWGMLHAVGALAPFWIEFPLAVLAVFGTHHRLSQAKGIWSLYNLRASTLSMPGPSMLERAAQQHWVSVGLLTVMIAWLFVPSGPDRMFPLLQAIPGEAAFLPRAVSYVLAAGWTAFVAFILVVMARQPDRHLPKMLHIVTHGMAVLLAVVAPVWGAVVWGAIHGLEYYFLCARMMAARPGDTFAAPGTRLGHPVVVGALIVLAMSPIVLVGLVDSPFAFEVFASAQAGWAVTAVNALVVAHYFADAFIYRFRIPEVRKVALARLGFA